MRNRLDEQLELLNTELIRMGALCEDGISQAAKVLVTRDEALRRAVDETEQEIDRKEREIEAICLRLLLQQQPVAKDLRLISAAMKMIADMERIGDPGFGYCRNGRAYPRRGVAGQSAHCRNGARCRENGDEQRRFVCAP